MADSKLANLLRNDNAWKGDADLAAFNQFEAQAEPWYRKGLPMEGRGTFLPFRDTLPDSVMNQREWALPSIIAAPINAFTAPFRAATGSDPTFNAPEEAMNLAGSVFGGGVGTSRAITAPTGVGGKDLALNAYHGTPHEVQGGFNLNKVGSGEGAQVFGHGMYFAENPEVAKSYQTKLSQKPDIAVFRSDDGFYVKKGLGSEGQNIVGPFKTGAEAEKARLGLPENQGNLYKVDIPDAAIPMMIDWDKSISSQSPKVLEFLKQHPAILEDLNAGKSLDTLKGRNAYEAIASSFDVGPKEAYKLASEYLANQGITGIRYLDEGSRGNFKAYTTYKGNKYGDEISFPTKEQLDNYIAQKKQEGFGVEVLPQTSNFVVFKPETVEILEKNSKSVDRKDLIKEQIDKLTE